MAAPGVVAEGYGNALTVVDASSGKQLFNYQDTAASSRFWWAATISHGVLYIGNKDGNLYAFATGSGGPPPPTGTPGPAAKGPVSKSWYFAEGKVGAGFSQYLTLQNPDPTTDCSVSIQYLLGHGSPVSKTVTVPHASRLTESVNADLGLPASAASYQTDSAILSVSNASSCAGIVAERPMYFTNFLGVSSGTDVLGATQTAKSFYFADVPTGGGYASFLTILNPPGNPVATVTATFYAHGQQLGTALTQQVGAGQRGTIGLPNGGALQHAAVMVTSSQPVVVERPTYFHNIPAGHAGLVSGAASLVGVPAPGTSWLFAEGYTGGQFQETLVLANFNTASANATITL